MTTAKGPATNGRAAKVLGRVRQLFDVGYLDRATLGEIGIDVTADSLSLGDHRLLTLIVEAGRATGFGSDPFDTRIRTFLDGSYGVGRWQKDRPPHPWERGGGDAELDRLAKDEAIAIADCERDKEQIFVKRDELTSLRDKEGVTLAMHKAAAQEMEDAIETYERSREREMIARGRFTTRALWLQERWRRQESARMAKSK